MTVNLCDVNNLKEINDRTAKRLEKWLNEILPQTDMTITFTKKDGTERVMRCTLQPKLLPPQPVVENKEPRKKAEGVITVYDLDVKDWRSIIVKSITKVSLTVG